LWKIDFFFYYYWRWSVDEREMKQVENGHILFFIFFVIVKWVVQSSFKIDWFSFFLLIFFYVVEKVGCYFIYFFK